jgi:hypothetical protein
MPLPQLTRRTSQEKTLNTRRLRKISSKHLTLWNDHTDKVPSRVQNPRTTRPKQHLETLIQQLGHRKQIVSKRLNKGNTPESDLVTHLNLTFEKHTPTPIVPKVMYLLVTIGTRLENHPLSPVICLEQPESINLMFFKSPT